MNINSIPYKINKSLFINGLYFKKDGVNFAFGYQTFFNQEQQL
jgi:hypothetical protein